MYNKMLITKLTRIVIKEEVKVIVKGGNCLKSDSQSSRKRMCISFDSRAGLLSV